MYGWIEAFVSESRPSLMDSASKRAATRLVYRSVNISVVTLIAILVPSMGAFASLVGALSYYPLSKAAMGRGGMSSRLPPFTCPCGPAPVTMASTPTAACSLDWMLHCPPADVLFPTLLFCAVFRPKRRRFFVAINVVMGIASCLAIVGAVRTMVQDASQLELI
jgi:hypothetical protein